MSWIQLELSTQPEQVDALEDLLLGHGAVAITLLSDSEERVLEPRPGETPLWQHIRLHALFDVSHDFKPLRESLAEAGTGWDVQFIGEENWLAKARAFAVDEIFGERLRLCPPGTQTDPELATLLLEPGMAFGSGSHPTTKLCLQWLAQHVRPGMQVLDFGCGSGVLAIAASLLGARSVAVDHDPQALVATASNGELNHINSDSLTCLDLPAWQAFRKDHHFDVVVANILAQPLKSLAGEFQSVTQQGASIVLSGILVEQVDEVMLAYPEVRFEPASVLEGWACLYGVRS